MARYVFQSKEGAEQTPPQKKDRNVVEEIF